MRPEPRATARRRHRRRAPRACLVLVIAGVLGLAPGTGASARAAEAPDARDAPGPLDVTHVTLEQRDVRLALRVATAGRWTGGDLVERPGRALCVTLVHGSPATARGQICVTGRGERAALSYARLGDDGHPLAARRLVADVARPSAGVLEATFLPAAAGLSLGPYSWFAHSAWSDAGACAGGCADRAPDVGVVAADMELLGVPRCFGAAARDPLRPCDNPDLRLTVEPPPSNLPPPFTPPAPSSPAPPPATDPGAGNNPQSTRAARAKAIARCNKKFRRKARGAKKQKLSKQRAACIRRAKKRFP